MVNGDVDSLLAHSGEFGIVAATKTDKLKESTETKTRETSEN